MAVTEVTVESWGSRLGGAFKGILAGIVLFVLAFPLLFWNEGRAVRRARALEKGAASVVAVSAEKVQSENEGKLIHVSGMLATDDTLVDPVLGITIKGIRLKREVEMYQWKEKSSTKSEKQLGGSVKKTTVYTYEKCWSSSLIDSSSFREAGHNNPAAFPLPSETWYAADVRLGAFTLPRDMIRRIGAAEPCAFPADYKLPAAVNGRIENGMIVIPAVQGAASAAPAAPQIGDVRITLTQILPHELSVVAQQIKGSFCAYPVGQETISLMADSIQSAELMFSHAQSANNVLTWVLRIVGFLMMFFGLSMVLKPLSVLTDVLPFLGDLVEMGSSLVAFLIALPCALVVIAVAWLFFRPVLGIALLVLAGAAVVCLIRIRKRKKAEKAA